MSNFIIRVMIWCSTACSASSVGAGASTNSGAPPELVLDALRQVGIDLGLLEEGRGVLLHQAVQRGLFLAVALAAARGAIRRPLGLLHHGLHARLPKW